MTEFSELRSVLPEGVKADAELKSLNTLGFSARARFMASPDSEQSLRSALEFACQYNLAVLPIGGGSNLIVDCDPQVLLIRMANNHIRYSEQEDDKVLLTVGAGVCWHDLVMDSVVRGYSGLENLALIPGLAGAAPIQNIGAYGVELSDRLVCVRGLFIDSGAAFELSQQECNFAYRDSIFKKQLAGKVVITELVLKLSKSHENFVLAYGDLAARMADTEITPVNIAAEICKIRSSKLPAPDNPGNAGSFFKNPIVDRSKAEQLREHFPDIPVYPVKGREASEAKLAAGWLIDRCGLKGFRAGSVGVYEKQALVLVHYGQGSAEELLALADYIRSRVLEKFSVVLEIEPPKLSDLIRMISS